MRQALFLTICLMILFSVSIQSKDKKYKLKFSDLFQQVELLDFEVGVDGYKNRSNSLIYVYAKELAYKIPKGKDGKHVFSNPSDYVTLASVKKEYGEDVFANSINIKSFLNKRKRKGLVLIDKSTKDHFQVYIYESGHGNCLLIEEDLEVGIKQHGLKRVLNEYYFKAQKFISKMSVNNQAKFVQFSYKKEHLVYPSALAKYMTNVEFLVRSHPKLIFVKPIDGNIKYKYSVETKLHYCLTLNYKNAKNKTIVLSLWKKNKSIKKKISCETSFQKNITFLKKEIEGVLNVDFQYMDMKLSKRNYLSEIREYGRPTIKSICQKYYLLPEDDSGRSSYYKLFRGSKSGSGLSLYLIDPKMYDKITLQVEKFRVIEEDLQIKQVRGSRSDINQNLKLVFQHKFYNKNELDFLSDKKLEFFKKNISTFLEGGHLADRVKGYLALPSIELIVEWFQVINRQLKSSVYSNRQKEAVYRAFFNRLHEFNLTKVPLNKLQKNKNLNYVKVFIHEKGDTLLSMHAIIYYLRNIDRDLPNIVEIQNDLSAMIHRLILKDPKLSNGVSLYYISNVSDKATKSKMLDELEVLFQQHWNTQHQLLYFDLYELYRDARIQLLEDRSVNYATIAKRKQQWRLEESKRLSRLIVTWAKKNDSYEFKFVRLLIRENATLYNEAMATAMQFAYFHNLYKPLIEMGFNNKSFEYLLFYYFDKNIHSNISKANYENSKGIFEYLAEQGYFINNKSKLIEMKKNIKILSLKIQSNNNKNVLPVFLKPKLIMMRKKIVEELRLVFGSHRYKKLSSDFIFTEAVLVSVFYVQENENRVAIYLCRNDIQTGLSLSIKKITKTTNLTAASKSLFNPNEDKDQDEICVIDDRVYYLKRNQLLVADFKNKSLELFTASAFKNENVKSIHCYNKKLFIFKKVNRKSNEFGYYDEALKSYNCLLLNSDNKSNGLVNTNDFSVRRVMSFNNRLFIRLNSKATGSHGFHEKLCELDFKSKKLSSVGSMDSVYGSRLHFYKNKFYYFGSDSYYVLDLLARSDFKKHKKSWTRKLLNLPFRDGFLYLDRVGRKDSIAYYDQKTKKTLLNVDSHISLSRDAEYVRTPKGLTISNGSSILYYAFDK